jgi:hypothetical protein
MYYTFRKCPNHNFLSKPLCSEESIVTILLFHIYKLTTFKTAWRLSSLGFKINLNEISITQMFLLPTKFLLIKIQDMIIKQLKKHRKLNTLSYKLTLTSFGKKTTEYSIPKWSSACYVTRTLTSFVMVKNNNLFILNIYIYHVLWHSFPGNRFTLGCEVYQHVLATKT